MPKEPRRFLGGVAAAWMYVAAGNAALAVPPAFQGLGFLPGGSYSFASAVSDDGTTVVGQARPTNTSSSFEACRWTAATGMVGLGSLGNPTPQSHASDVSADGSIVVGNVKTTSSMNSKPFRWTATEGMTLLVDPTGTMFRGQADAVSSDGQAAAGTMATPMGNQAFHWTAPTGIQGIGWVPNNFHDSFGFGMSADGAVVVGCSGAPSVEPFFWNASSGMVGLGDVPGGHFYAIAWGVSGDGTTLVGTARVASGIDEAFIWSATGGFVQPDPLREATAGSAASAASLDGGRVVGFSIALGAMIWDAVNGMRSVQAMLVDDLGLDLTGWTLYTAEDISADGTAIVGHGRNPDGNFEAWIARIPALPTAAPLPGAGPRIQLSLHGPNPFVTRTALAIDVPVHLPGRIYVRACVCRVDGRVVRDFVDQPMTAGRHIVRWDGTRQDGSRVAAGVYVFRVESGSATASRKLVLLD